MKLRKDGTDYWELYTRNNPIITLEQQQQIKDLKVGIAGCGSTGGAFVDGILRLGVTYYHLCDNGFYDLSNLNRQMVTRKDIGKNKAMVYKDRLINVNPCAQVKVWTEGLTDQNILSFLQDIDLLFDAIDVTTAEGMRMKLNLHEHAANCKIPTASALDLGFTQRLQSFNYHRGETALQGRLQTARQINNPLKAILAGFLALEELPYEFIDELIRLLEAPEASACQLASACFLLSSLATPYTLYFLKHKRLPPLTSINILSPFETIEDIEKNKTAAEVSLRHLKEMLVKSK